MKANRRSFHTERPQSALGSTFEKHKGKLVEPSSIDMGLRVTDILMSGVDAYIVEEARKNNLKPYTAKSLAIQFNETVNYSKKPDPDCNVDLEALEEPKNIKKETHMSEIAEYHTREQLQ